METPLNQSWLKTNLGAIGSNSVSPLRSRLGTPSAAAAFHQPSGNTENTLEIANFSSNDLQLENLVPPVNETTVCELRCEMITTKASSSENELRDDYIKEYPNIALKRGYRGEVGGNLRRECISDNTTDDNNLDTNTGWISTLQNVAKKTMAAFWPVNSESTDSIHKTLGNDGSPISAYASHPLTRKFAIARFDGAVEIHTSVNVPYEILMHEKQVEVTCLSWNPALSNRLAVGCKNGIILWDLGEISVARLFSCEKTTTMSWSPFGDYLASGSVYSNTVHVWDISRSVSSQITRPGNTGLLLWSPDGNQLLQTTIGGVFRVWETKTWTCERWATPTGSKCQAACWSCTGQVLLLAVAGTSLIFSLQFQDTSNSALYPVFDTAMVDIEGSEHVGGEIHAMAWDDTNERLAVSFTKSQPTNCSLVAMFRTHLRYSSAHPEVLTSGFIRGPPDVHPSCVQFQSRECFKNANSAMAIGAILSVGWLHADGLDQQQECHFQFIPMYFSADFTRKKKNIR